MKRFCDNITNLSLPEECDIVYIPNHKIPGNFYAEQSKVKHDIDMIGLNVGGNVYMNGLTVGEDVRMDGLTVGRYVRMNKMSVGGGVDMNGLTVGEDVRMDGLTVGGDVRMNELNVGRYVCMNKMSVGKCVDMRKLNVGGNVYMDRSHVGTLSLSTKPGIVIPFISFDDAKINEFYKEWSILVSEVSKRNAELPKNLEEALEEGMDLAKRAQVLAV